LPTLSLYNHPPTPHISTLSLHDALPIWFNRECRCAFTRSDEPHLVTRQQTWQTPAPRRAFHKPVLRIKAGERHIKIIRDITATRSEEHTSELQSQSNLVCRLLLEKKKKK